MAMEIFSHQDDDLPVFPISYFSVQQVQHQPVVRSVTVALQYRFFALIIHGSPGMWITYINFSFHILMNTCQMLC